MFFSILKYDENVKSKIQYKFKVGRKQMTV